jgi:hypothetical protein
MRTICDQCGKLPAATRLGLTICVLCAGIVKPKERGMTMGAKFSMIWGMVVVIVSLTVLSATFAAKAQAHNSRIPNYVMAAATGAASINGHARCYWTSWTHQHIRCRMVVGGSVGYLTIHRIYGHRYLGVGTMYGVVIYRKYMRL